MNWPNLPESYGEGQRQFDMAKSVSDAIEPTAWLAGMLALAALADRVSLWLALPCAAAIYLWLTVPARRRLAKSRKLWEADIVAYQDYLSRQQPE